MIKRKMMLALVLSAGLAVCTTGCGSKSDSETSSASAGSDASASVSVSGTSAGAEEVKGMEFPCELEDGKLLVTSFFQSDIDNPDCGNETGEGIASIEVTNQSDECLSEGTFTVTTEDGTEIPFAIFYLPAGETGWAFATDNTVVDDTICESITDEAQFTSDDLLMTDTFTVSVENTTVSLTNSSDADQSNITVYCHSTMDGTIFGGVTYTYTVDSLAAGETTTIDASDCWLGEAEAVRISVGEY